MYRLLEEAAIESGSVGAALVLDLKLHNTFLQLWSALLREGTTRTSTSVANRLMVACFREIMPEFRNISTAPSLRPTTTWSLSNLGHGQCSG